MTTTRKMSFRNRCVLSGGNGIINLSVPLIGGRGQKSLMKDVRIDNRENWQARHWKTISSCYNKSPWFEYYRQELERLYSRKFYFLLHWNLECMKWICANMAIKTTIVLSESIIKKYDVTTFMDRRNRFLPSTINLVNPSPERYPQVFEERSGFIPNLSILDRLFCAGNKI